MRTDELAGAELALWVARTIGLHITCDTWQGPDCDSVLPSEGPGLPMFRFKPHTDWAQGGPLLEQHKITVEEVLTSGGGSWWHARKYPHQMNGPTYLISAMRALVASVYGDTVPDDKGGA